MITIYKPKNKSYLPKTNFCCFSFDAPTVESLYNISYCNNSLEITDHTLLSLEELRDFGDFIKGPLSTESECWYLITPGDDNTIYAADYNEEGYSYRPYDIITTVLGIDGIGLRPILRIKDNIINDEITLEPGDVVKIGHYFFTLISKNILLSEAMLDKVDGKYPVFDQVTNIYANSSAKKSVDNWFENEIRPYL